VAYDDDNRKVNLSLRQADILATLAKDDELRRGLGCVPNLQNVARQHRSLNVDLADRDSDRNADQLPVFHPEFGRFMLEATPGKPWGIGLKDLLDVEPNMRWRFVDTLPALLALLYIGANHSEKTDHRQRSYGTERVSNHFNHVPAIRN
jgi:hypothetical protein